MLSDSPGVAIARSGRPHSGFGSRGNSQNAASARGNPSASSLPTLASVPASTRPAVPVAGTSPSSAASRCRASSASVTASSASSRLVGPWSSRKVANGANSPKPSRLRPSRRLKVSDGFSASIAASTAQAVSRPMPGETQATASSAAAPSSSRSSAGNGRCHANPATTSAPRPNPAPSGGGRRSSSGSRQAAAASSTSRRAPALISGVGTSSAMSRLPGQQRQCAQTTVAMQRALAQRYLRLSGQR